MKLKGNLLRLCSLFVFALLAIASAFPQTFVTVTGTRIINLQGVLATNATLCGQIDYSVKVGGGGQTTLAPVCAAVTNGAFTIQLPDTSTTTPVNACVTVTVTDNQTGTYLLKKGYECVQPTSIPGSTWCSTTNGTTTCNFDLYSPNYPGLQTMNPPTGGGATVYGASSSQAGTVFLAAGINSNVLSREASTGLYSDLIGAPSGGPSAPATSSVAGAVLLASGQSSNTLSKVATTGIYADLTGLPAAILGASSTTAGTVKLASGQSSNILSKAATTGLYADLIGLPTPIVGATSSIAGTVLLASGQSSDTLATVATTGAYADLSGTPVPLMLETQGTPNPNQAVLNIVAGSGLSISTSADGTVLISYATTSPLPTPPSTAYTYTNLQTEPNTCPSYISSSSQGSATNCWTADSIDATAAAGAGIATPTLLKFGVTSPSLSSGGAMQSSVSNSPPAVTSATGSAGGNTITVSSVSGIPIGATVTGTGIGAGAAVSNTWNKSSATIPLTVVNSGTVSGNATFTNTFVSNSLYYRHLLSGTAPTTPTQVTVGTLTINPGTVSVNGNTLSFSGMTATDTTYTVTAIQVYVDGSLAFTNSTGTAPFSPASTSITLAAGTHSYDVKAFDSNGTSAQTSAGSVGIGGTVVANVSHLLEDFYFYLPSSNTPQAYEWDPDQTVNGNEAFASMQCDVAAGSNAPGYWRFWNSFAGGTLGGSPAPYGAWTQAGTNYSCTNLTTNSWHHFQLYATYDVPNKQYSYQTLVIDGATVFQNINLTFNDKPLGNGYTGLGVQLQIDNTSSTPRTGTGNTEYVDNLQLTTW